jgi:hypothetical protein
MDSKDVFEKLRNTFATLYPDIFKELEKIRTNEASFETITQKTEEALLSGKKS